MKTFCALGVAALLLAGCSSPARSAPQPSAAALPVPAVDKVAAKPLFRDPVYDGAADPTVIYSAGDKKWYMFYTVRRANVAGLNGVGWVHGTPIGIATSSDGGADWQYLGQAKINYPGAVADATWWAPAVVFHQGTYHMFLSYVPGTFSDGWGHPRDIIHLTSGDLIHWDYQSTLPLSSHKVIDPGVLRLPDGTWRLWYKDEANGSSTHYADSPDLDHWTDGAKVPGLSDAGGEAPLPFHWKGRYWFLRDITGGAHGLGLYRSDDAVNWERVGTLLQQPGTGADDKVIGHHPDVIISGDRAYVFYFTHPGQARSGADGSDQRRSSIQVAELNYDAVNDVLTVDRDRPTLIALRPPEDAETNSKFTADLAAPEPPKSWIDPDTGHRVIRLTREPDSVSFYFNDNGYTPDGKEMIYTTPAGICVLKLATLESRLVVPSPARAVALGRKTPTIYYTKPTDRPRITTLFATNVDTGESREIGDLPRRSNVYSVNADETLVAGTQTVGDAPDNLLKPIVENLSQTKSRSSSQNGIQATNKTQLMEERLARRLPMVLYTLDLHTGTVKSLWQGTDWIDHVQFSPTDPTLLIYAHEGLWQLVDRLWMIHTDGTGNQLVHRRTMEMETDGHEWWGFDGKRIWYQLHYPPHMQASFLASYNVENGERIWYYYSPDQTSIHHNVSPDGKLFCGDGNFGTPWIFLGRPVLNRDNHTLGTNLIKGGYLEPEKLVNLGKTTLHAAHNYMLEPNPSFTPDEKWVVFASNMFGPSYVFAVEVAKANAPAGDLPAP